MVTKNLRTHILDPRVLGGAKLEIINFARFRRYGKRSKGEEKKDEKNSFHEINLSQLCSLSN
jgi:hypothetical protein